MARTGLSKFGELLSQHRFLARRCQEAHSILRRSANLASRVAIVLMTRYQNVMNH